MTTVVVIVYLLLAGLTEGCGGSGKGNGNPPPLIAPSGLSYSQPAIAATMNHAVTVDVPTVTGTVDSYTVTPGLPAGLILNSSTGTISGIPTGVSAKTSYTVTAANSSGATATTIQITVSLPTPPTDLSYSEPTIDAATNVAISDDVPSVSGDVTSYAVSPALPAGLNLSSSTGIISGTPTALAPLVSYTVTASNAGGAASAAILISVTVLLPAPTAIAYAQTVIGTYVGQEITPDIPGTEGTITSYAISPALPVGLSMDPATGVISGSPTAPAPQTTYVVTGTNTGGSITAVVSPAISVTQAPDVLLQLGNQDRLGTLEIANSRVLSEDWYGLWILWDYKAGTILASGDAGLGGGNVQGFSSTYAPTQSAMAGPALAIGIPGGIEVLSASDGHLLSTIVSPGFIYSSTGGLIEANAWQLAADGSYISIETQSGLFAYSPTGQMLFSRPGNYLLGSNSSSSWPLPNIFAAPGQIQVANGPAGPDQNIIETISVPSGVSTLSPPFQGPFDSWFTDGGRFIAGGQIYSSDGVPEGALPPGAPPCYRNSCPPPLQFGGMGNWLWSLGVGSAGQPQSYLSIYPIGSTTPVLTAAITVFDIVVPSGTIIGDYGMSSLVKVIDLSGATPTETDYTVPSAINNATSHYLGEFPFAAVSSAEWVTGFANGLILDGASLASNAPRYLGIGSALSIAGSTANTAIATGSGEILYLDPANTTSEGSVSLTSGKVALSSDGTVLAASSQDETLLEIESLPSGTVNDTFSYPGQAWPGLLSDFTLSSSGATLAQAIGGCLEQVSPASGSPIIWSSAFSAFYEGLCGPILLSPDGTLIAVNDETVAVSNIVTIYQGGDLITTVAGAAVGWIDNGRLLVNQYTQTANGPVYSGCTIYSSTGAVLATPSLPELGGIQTVTSNTVYAPNRNAIYSLTTGQATWTSPFPPDSWNNSGTAWLGAVSGPYVVFESEGRIIAVKY